MICWIKGIFHKFKDMWLDLHNEILCPYAPLDTPFTVICDKRVKESDVCKNCCYRDVGDA